MLITAVKVKWPLKTPHQHDLIGSRDCDYLTDKTIAQTDVSGAINRNAYKSHHPRGWPPPGSHRSDRLHISHGKRARVITGQTNPLSHTSTAFGWLTGRNVGIISCCRLPSCNLISSSWRAAKKNQPPTSRLCNIFQPHLNERIFHCVSACRHAPVYLTFSAYFHHVGPSLHVKGEGGTS